MKVTLTDGNTFSTNPVHNCTGYRASKLEMEPGDFYKLAQVVRNNPEQAYAILMQLDGRFDTSRKEPVQPSSYADLANYYTDVEFERDPVVAKRHLVKEWCDNWQKNFEPIEVEPDPSFAQKRMTLMFETPRKQFRQQLEQHLQEALKAVNGGELPNTTEMMVYGRQEMKIGSPTIYYYKDNPILKASINHATGGEPLTFSFEPLCKKEG